MTMSDRIAVLRDGTVQQVAAPELVYRRPVNRWVAEFVGTPPMNFLPATPRRQGGRLVLVVDAAPAAVLESVVTDVPEAVAVGVRPEHVVMHRTPMPGALAGRVHVVAPAGDQAIVAVRTEAGLVQVKTGADAPPKMEDAVFLTVQPGKIHLFRRDTGERIGP